MNAYNIILAPGDTLSVTTSAAPVPPQPIPPTPTPVPPGPPIGVPPWAVETVPYVPNDGGGINMVGPMVPQMVYAIVSDPMPSEPYNVQAVTYASVQCPNGGTPLNAVMVGPRGQSQVMQNPNPSATMGVGPGQPVNAGERTTFYVWLNDGWPTNESYRFSQFPPR